MSTRATYKFIKTQSTPEITIYLHHDGYPEGAAFYIYNAIASGNFDASSFLRCNDKAEITSGHHAHADTDYQYTFNGLEMICAKYQDEKYGFCIEYQGTIKNFVNSHFNTAWLKGQEVNSDIVTFNNKLETIENLLQQIEEYKKFPQYKLSQQELENFLNGTPKGLIVDIYKCTMPDCSNNGISATNTKALIVGEHVPEIFDAGDLPVLTIGKLGNKPHAKPLSEDGKHYMCGGAFVSTSDSRFSKAVLDTTGITLTGALSLHDRTE